MRCYFIDLPREKFTGDTAVQREKKQQHNSKSLMIETTIKRNWKELNNNLNRKSILKTIEIR